MNSKTLAVVVGVLGVGVAAWLLWRSSKKGATVDPALVAELRKAYSPAQVAAVADFTKTGKTYGTKAEVVRFDRNMA